MTYISPCVCQSALRAPGAKVIRFVSAKCFSPSNGTRLFKCVSPEKYADTSAPKSNLQSLLFWSLAAAVLVLAQPVRLSERSAELSAIALKKDRAFFLAFPPISSYSICQSSSWRSPRSARPQSCAACTRLQAPPLPRQSVSSPRRGRHRQSDSRSSLLQ